MEVLHFFDGRTLLHESDQTSNIISANYKVGLNGSLNGQVTLKVDSSNNTFLSTLKDCSHFIKIGDSNIYGGVIDGKPILDTTKNILTVKFIGPYEYLEKVDMTAPHKASIESATEYSSDYSFIKLYYSDSSVGVLHEVLRDLKQAVGVRGFDNGLFNYSSLSSNISTTTNTNWERSYRLNIMETPTVRTVIDEIIGDSSMELFKISTSPTLSGSFSFNFEIVSSSTVYTLSEETDSIFNVSEEEGDTKRRAYSIAKGTDLSDRSVVERVIFDPAVAYSTLIEDTPAERSGAIRRFAVSNALREGSSEGVLKFSSFVDTYDVLDYITLSSPRMGSSSGVVTEKNVENNQFEYTIQLGSPSTFNATLSKPSSKARKLIYNPINHANSLSTKTAGRQTNSTGWRT